MRRRRSSRSHHSSKESKGREGDPPAHPAPQRGPPAADGVYGPIGPFLRPNKSYSREEWRDDLARRPTWSTMRRCLTAVPVHVRVGLPEDGYIRPEDIETVTVELYGDGEHLAAVNTILDPDQIEAATHLLRRIVAGLESGELHLPPARSRRSRIASCDMTDATLHTNQGAIAVELFDDDAPKTVDNFLSLAGQGFYDGAIFHRVIPDFMIQGGDPTGTGSGGPGYTFEDEFNDRPVERGALAMANAGPNMNGSQFFIVTAEACPWLDGKHMVFGRVTDGMDVIDAISALDSRDARLSRPGRRHRTRRASRPSDRCTAGRRRTGSGAPRDRGSHVDGRPALKVRGKFVVVLRTDPAARGPLRPRRKAAASAKRVRRSSPSRRTTTAGVTCSCASRHHATTCASSSPTRGCSPRRRSSRQPSASTSAQVVEDAGCLLLAEEAQQVDDEHCEEHDRLHGRHRDAGDLLVGPGDGPTCAARARRTRDRRGTRASARPSGDASTNAAKRMRFHADDWRPCTTGHHRQTPARRYVRCSTCNSECGWRSARS